MQPHILANSNQIETQHVNSRDGNEGILPTYTDSQADSYRPVHRPAVDLGDSYSPGVWPSVQQHSGPEATSLHILADASSDLAHMNLPGSSCGTPACASQSSNTYVSVPLEAPAGPNLGWTESSRHNNGASTYSQSDFALADDYLRPNSVGSIVAGHEVQMWEEIGFVIDNFYET